MLSNFKDIKETQRHVDALSRSWDKQKGGGFASEYSVIDSDMSSMVFDTLLRYGVQKNMDVILNYEEKDWFRCYDLESDPSISANVHVLGALREAGYRKDNPSISKIIRFLQQTKSNWGYWGDKWHISPYYTTSHAVMVCAGFADEVVSDAVEWLINTQRTDGSWGLFGSTAEETAYALQALWLWDQRSQRVPKECLHKGKIWLENHQDYEYNPLWIGKCLYSPRLVIDSAVATALELVN